MPHSYVLERIREIWSKLSTDKRRFLDVLLHSTARKLLGEVIANEYLPIRDSRLADRNAAQLPEIHIVLQALDLMPDAGAHVGRGDPRVMVLPYIAEAFGAIVEGDAKALFEYSEAYGKLGDTPGVVRMQDAGAYDEAYNVWVEKTALYLRECRSTVRAVSFNEFTHLWDKPSAVDYLATNYLLRAKRGCDSRRVFVYDNSYWENKIVLKRLFAEVQIQSEAGVNARLCSMEHLKRIGKGYYYPILSFGTYDRAAMGVLIPHDAQPVVKLIHDPVQIRDGISILDEIFDCAETGPRWSKKHASLLDEELEEYIRLKTSTLRRAIKHASLD